MFSFMEYITQVVPSYGWEKQRFLIHLNTIINIAGQLYLCLSIHLQQVGEHHLLDQHKGRGNGWTRAWGWDKIMTWEKRNQCCSPNFNTSWKTTPLMNTSTNCLELQFLYHWKQTDYTCITGCFECNPMGWPVGINIHTQQRLTY